MSTGGLSVGGTALAAGAPDQASTTKTRSRQDLEQRLAHR
jgi:hypothetical protein